MAELSGFWVSISDALYTQYNTSVNENILHDDGSQKWLRLRLAPSGVQRSRIFLGETGTVRGVDSAQRRKPTQKLGLELATIESREVVFSILESLIDEQVTVKDYLSPPNTCLLYTSPSPRDGLLSRMPSSA